MKKMYNRDWREEQAASLCNEILAHMIKKGLTLQVLDEAVSNVTRAFYTDATFKKADTNGQPSKDGVGTYLQSSAWTS